MLYGCSFVIPNLSKNPESHESAKCSASLPIETSGRKFDLGFCCDPIHSVNHPLSRCLTFSHTFRHRPWPSPCLPQPCSSSYIRSRICLGLVEESGIVMSRSVCLSVCPRAYLLAPHVQASPNFSCSCLFPRLDPPLAALHRCNTLCNSGFVDNVMFSYIRRDLWRRVMLPQQHQSSEIQRLIVYTRWAYCRMPYKGEFRNQESKKFGHRSSSSLLSLLFPLPLPFFLPLSYLPLLPTRFLHFFRSLPFLSLSFIPFPFH